MHIAFLGLGNMGSGMAANQAKAGRTVHAFDLSAAALERAKANGTKVLYITHQQIADELHTHREAVSRLLRTMEQKNMLRLGRNTIELL